MAFLFNRTNWGRIRLTGADRVRFLHNQTTNSIEQLSAGQGCLAVFVTSTGRTIDLATIYAFEESLLVVASPGMAKQLYDWMDRYIFFSDKVTLSDESDQTFMFTLLGEGADDAIAQLCDVDINAMGEEKGGRFSHWSVGSIKSENKEITAPIAIAQNTDLALKGYTLWGSKQDAEAVESTLLTAGATAQSQADWETLRIQQGRPMPNAELTDDDNPLEAGLWSGVSFQKGCYIGQETIARLNTYKGVKKRLWGLKLQEPVPSDMALPELSIVVDGKKVGRVTSLNVADDFGLGYVRTKAGGEGLDVLIEGEQVEVMAKTVAVPFVRHEYYTAE